MSKENFLTISFGMNNNYEKINNFNNNLEHSFYKNLTEVVLENTTDIIDFELNEDFTSKEKDHNDLNIDYSNTFYKNNTYLYSNNINNNDILFSGYFGQKEENLNGNREENRNIKKTKPFPRIEEEKINHKMDTTYGSNYKKSSKKNNNTSNISFTNLVKSIDLKNNSFKKKSKIILKQK